MKIALINGSPKKKRSSSATLLHMFKELIASQHEIAEYHFHSPTLTDQELDQVSSCDILVFAFPLYVDGIPSHLLNCLSQMELFFKTKVQKEMDVYALMNCGFYEARQNSIALEMMKNWSIKSGLKWIRGIGIGGGGAIPMTLDNSGEKSIMKETYKAMSELAQKVEVGEQGENLFVNPSIPRIAYKLGGEMGWRKAIKRRGLKRKDLDARK